MMPTAKKREQPTDPEKQKRETLPAIIGAQVMHILGEPGNLLKVQVRSLWGDFYRVNVVIGENIACAKIADSYFVKADGEGKIADSIPKITRRYEPVNEGPANLPS